MTKRLTKILSLLFVFAILASTVSATDIITGATALRPPDAETQATCNIRITVNGVYVERWASNYPYLGEFVPNADEITNVYYNGHRHTGTLTIVGGVDVGEWLYDGYEGADPTKYYAATAIYGGTLTCVN